ncbi:glycoside hydrolase family 47 protein [Bipolaris zeicola 26-R-13]|uniref:alpha-1,2-Mannosidase n=1 Tax=Cochliobolus carbonum (strain 26-R-13) TaxID=930089 RepID=W6YG14_COCC2|nr:glycoside hydrolase family 47 protein [Bipolaris zeicola 26-R-13]EUC36588.1 glycoside hydrolase family 47 protein [Bipolaris zeicola 26-R-13]
MRRIKVPRGVPYQQPMSRQHKRFLLYALGAALLFGVCYRFFGEPIDPLAVPFEDHEAYMRQSPSLANLESQQSYDWRKAPFVNRISSYIPLPTSKPRKLPRIQAEYFPETRAQRNQRESQRIAVRNVFKRTWKSYRTYAWAQDELKPVTAEGEESFGGWGATLVDSLDTLWIMGLREEFDEAVEAVAAIDFGRTNLTSVSVFETTIRYLGGLLSAYDMSGKPILLKKAIQLGEMLYRAFDTTNNTPLGWMSVEKAKKVDRDAFDAETNICFACLGSLTMEFTRLAQITAESKYYDAVARVTLLMDRVQNSTKIPGLWPTMVNVAREDFTLSGSFSIGALADSTYEYFPKMHALLGGVEPVYEKLYRDSAKKIDEHMLFRPMVPDKDHGENLLLCGDVSAYSDQITLNPTMQHLTCFIGGMFGLAGRIFSIKEHVDLGAKLTKGCVYSYAATQTGIMPETFDMVPCESRTSCPWNRTTWAEGVLTHYGNKYIDDFDAAVEKYSIPTAFTNIRDRRYLLRPEAIESVFIMYRITGDRHYLDNAWDMFNSIVAATETEYGYGQVRDVTFVAPQDATATTPTTTASSAAWHSGTREKNIENKMESFWTAETLKYFYLVFSTPDMISLDDWVFNTEAHPFRRPKAG